ncbi:sensor histidine kinase [Sutcliffiella rhizosphaerae]|uniref:Sensor histidine kinase n=1 Tax=Sutcliffiella rhizosphaerae TaxID=2880967 RepID=A0ABN8AE14_9BACI|nr:sensor histidine kinase [Sutcliffiella rhizosphaerae]CAG9622526.1 Sensor histidine kinase LiaS [Sutcliffiella rhizosphaerae]
MTTYKKGKKIESLRFWYIRSFIVVSVVSSFLFFLFFQTLLLFYPEGLLVDVEWSVIIAATSFIITVLTSIYFGYKQSGYMKNRLDDLSTFIATLARGKFSERIAVGGKDELGRLTEDINQLAYKIQNQVKSLQKLADEKNELAIKAHNAATIEERQRLARELHDSVSQQLFALSIMSSAAIRMFDPYPEEAKKQLTDIASIAAKAQGEMRALLLHLRPISLTNDTLSVGIQKLLVELEERTPITFQKDIQDIDTLSNATEDHLFRIIQEALSNILRHADATSVKLDMHQKGKQYVYIFISDNGKGFELNTQKQSSYGLHTMRERCEEIGGQFSIRSKKGEGTHIEIHVPIREEEN